MSGSEIQHVRSPKSDHESLGRAGQRGAIVLQQKVTHHQRGRRLSNISRCLIGMETCSGTHFIARQLAALGHDVRLACFRIQRHGEKANRAGRISTTQLANGGPFGTVFPPTWQPRFGGAFSYKTRDRRTAHNLVSRRRLESYTYLRAHNFERAAAFVAIPDAFVIDYENEQWYIVKAELIAHGVWRHIVPQITSQIVACLNQDTRNLLTDRVLEHIASDAQLKLQTHIEQRVVTILRKEPVVAIPIDNSSDDLEA